jgi:hypothetical protein
LSIAYSPLSIIHFQLSIAYGPLSIANGLHHFFREAVVFNLLLGSLLEEILYQFVFFFSHIRFVLSSSPFSLFPGADATSPYSRGYPSPWQSGRRDSRR